MKKINLCDTLYNHLNKQFPKYKKTPCLNELDCSLAELSVLDGVLVTEGYTYKRSTVLVKRNMRKPDLCKAGFSLIYKEGGVGRRLDNTYIKTDNGRIENIPAN